MKRWISLGLVVLALLAGAAWLWQRPPAPPQVIPLSDGSQLAFVKATYGTNHYFIKNPWDIVGFLLQSKSRPFEWHYTETPTQVLWFKWRNQSNTVKVSSLTMSILDEQGKYSSLWTTPIIQQSLGSRGEITQINLPSFPRRGSHYTIKLYENNRSTQWEPAFAGEIRVKNPVRQQFKEWTPTPLPATAKDGDLEVTLSRLLAGASDAGSKEPTAATNALDLRAQLQFRIAQNGTVATNWSVANLTWSDATGNVAKQRSWSDTYKDAEYILLTDQFLWTDEPAWKVKLELSRTSGFQPEELMGIKGFPVSVEGQPASQLTQREFTLQGHKVTLESIQANHRGREFREGEHRTYFLKMRCDPPLPEGLRMSLLPITNEKGQPLRKIGWGGTSSPKGFSELSFSLDATNACQSLDFTLALHRSRFVEFVAKPEVLRK